MLQTGFSCSDGICSNSLRMCCKMVYIRSLSLQTMPIMLEMHSQYADSMTGFWATPQLSGVVLLSAQWLLRKKCCIATSNVSRMHHKMGVYEVTLDTARS